MKTSEKKATNSISGRTPPFDEVAEIAVLGALILDNGLIDEIRSTVREDNFFLEKHRIIYSAICSLHDLEINVDAVTLGTKIRDDGNLEKIGGVMMISGLTDHVATTANAVDYAKIVNSFSTRRRMIYAAQEIAAKGFDRGIDMGDFLSSSLSSIESVINDRPIETNVLPVSQTVVEATHDATSQSSPKGLIRTHISGLDDYIGGLWPGLLTLLASRPSMGKSMLAMNIAVNVALSGHNVLYFSPEDTRKFIQWRILSRLSGIPLFKMVRRQLNFSECERINRISKVVASLPIWIDDTSSIGVDEIKRATLDFRARHGADQPNLLIIDHLGHLTLDRGKDLYERITVTSKKLNDFIKDSNLANLVLHQLNRGNEGRKNNIPDLPDLRGSGELEQIARVVMFAHRPFYYDEHEDPGEFSVKLAKQSHGKTGFVKLFCDMPVMFVGDKENSNDFNDKISY